MRPAPRPFDSAEDGFIRANYRSMLARDIARHLGRSTTGIRKRAWKLGLSVPLQRWCDAQDAVVRAGRGKRELREVAAELGRGVAEVSSRAKHLGLAPWRVRKGTHAGRPIDGFANGRPIYTHRSVVERRLGRKLRSDEIVHHVDHDKANNSDANLYLFASRSAHRSAHSSFESLVPALLERGVIEFDRTEGIYRLCAIHR